MSSDTGMESPPLSCRLVSSQEKPKPKWARPKRNPYQAPRRKVAVAIRRISTVNPRIIGKGPGPGGNPNTANPPAPKASQGCGCAASSARRTRTPGQLP